MTIHFPTHSFLSRRPISREEDRRRYFIEGAVADLAEGARRDAHEYLRWRQSYTVRPALPAEYAGACLEAGLPPADFSRVLVIVCSDYGRLWRYYLPISPDILAAATDFKALCRHWLIMPPEIETRGLAEDLHKPLHHLTGHYSAKLWWAIASEMRMAAWIAGASETVLHDVLPQARGVR